MRDSVLQTGSCRTLKLAGMAHPLLRARTGLFLSPIIEDAKFPGGSSSPSLVGCSNSMMGPISTIVGLILQARWDSAGSSGPKMLACPNYLLLLLLFFNMRRDKISTPWTPVKIGSSAAKRRNQISGGKLYSLFPGTMIISSRTRPFRGLRALILLPLLLGISELACPSSASSSLENFSPRDGKVLELDESNLDTAIATFDYILVDFYAPWCGHCKRLSPELDAAAPVLSGLKEPVVIAKVDADKYKRVLDKHNIDGFPTLKLFVHGVAMEYHGPRKADLLVRFLKKFVAPDVSVLVSDAAISEFFETAGTNFPLFIGFGLEESVLSNVGRKYKKKAWFSVAKDFSEDVMVSYDFDKVPALVAIQPSYNERNIFYGPFEEKFLEDFVKQNFLPLGVPINSDTLKLLRDDDRKIVLTVMEDETDEESKNLVKMLKAAASANRDLVFAYVGVKQFEEFTDSFGTPEKAELPKMVVWDGNEEYFTVIDSEVIHGEDKGTQITKFLEGYREGRTVQNRVNGRSFMGYIKSLNMGVKIAYALVFLVIIVMIVLNFCMYEEPLRVGTREQADQGISSSSEAERKDYKSGEKED